MPQLKLDIVIAGEINMDLILYGLPAQMAVERELLASGFMATLGSSSAILAHNLSVLGTAVGFVCMAGRDDLGRAALDRLAASGTDISQTQYVEGMNTGVTILLAHGKERHILTYPGPMDRMRVADLDMDYIRSARHFHISSLFLQKALQPDLPELFRELKRAGLTLSLDTNDDPDDVWGSPLQELLELVDVFLPNEDELLRIARKNTVEEALDTLAARVPIIAVKCGARGAIVQHAGTRTLYKGTPIQTVDTIGAGDSFNAGFLNAWLAKQPIEQCARMGNLCGALSTQREGGTEAFRDKAFIAEFLAAHA